MQSCIAEQPQKENDAMLAYLDALAWHSPLVAHILLPSSYPAWACTSNVTY